MPDGLVSNPESIPTSTFRAPSWRIPWGKLIAWGLRLPRNQQLLSLGDQAIVSGTNFATTVILGRMAWEAELGTYCLGMTLVLLLLSALNSLISSPLTLFIQRKNGLSHAELVGISLLHTAILAGITSLGFLLVGLMLVSGVETHAIGQVLLALTLFAPLLMMRELARRAALAKLRMKTVLAVDLATCVLQLSGLVMLGRAGGLDAVTAFAAGGLACGLASAAWIFSIRRSLSFPWKLVWPEWVRNWSLGKWILIDQLTVTANMYLLYWLLAFWKDTSATGLYSACIAIVSLANPFVFGMTNLLAPRLAGAQADGDFAGVKRLVWTASGVVGGVVGAYCLVLMLWGDAVVVLCYGTQFAGQHWTIVTCALALFAGILGTCPSHGLWVQGRNDVNFKASLVGLMVTVMISVPLLEHWGAVAANCGLLAGNLTATLLRCWAFIRWDAQEPEATVDPANAAL